MRRAGTAAAAIVSFNKPFLRLLFIIPGISFTFAPGMTNFVSCYE